MKDFANNQTFSMKSVEENLLYPVITENKLLVEENHNWKIELSKAKNAISYYEDLENTNKQLEHNIKLKDIEINSMYEIIRDLSNKYDKLIKWIKNKFGVDKSKFDEKIKWFFYIKAGTKYLLYLLYKLSFVIIENIFFYYVVI